MDNLNTSRRLPIVFCLDVSPSMGIRHFGRSSSIKLLNNAVNNFIDDIKEDMKLSASIELSFVTFSTGIVKETDFINVNSIKKPVKFKAVLRGGTDTSVAVERSISKIEEYKRTIANGGGSFYVPFLVIITDGNPDQTEPAEKINKAIQLVRSHCSTHRTNEINNLIVPFVVGVGDDVDAETLRQLSAGFVDGFLTIRSGSDEKVKGSFRNLFKIIKSSAKKSQSLNADSVINSIKTEWENAINNSSFVCDE